jgi:hypothetical protein
VDEEVGLDALGFSRHLSARFLEAALALRAERVLELRADVSRAGELKEGYCVLLVRNVPRGRDVLDPSRFTTKRQIAKKHTPWAESWLPAPLWRPQTLYDGHCTRDSN